MGLDGIPAPAAPGLTEEQQSQRTTMELSLENPSKIITSSQPSTAGATTEPHPRCHIHMVFEQFQGWRLHCFPGLPLPVLPVTKFSLKSGLNLPWHNLRVFPLILSLVQVGCRQFCRCGEGNTDQREPHSQLDTSNPKSRHCSFSFCSPE